MRLISLRNLVTHLLIQVLIFLHFILNYLAQYHTFLKERLYNNTIDLNDTILKKTICLLFSDTQKWTEKHTSNLSNLIDDTLLFSRMYVSCQAI